MPSRVATCGAKPQIALHPALLDHLLAVRRYQEAFARTPAVQGPYLVEERTAVESSFRVLQGVRKSCADCSGARVPVSGPYAGATWCLVGSRPVGPTGFCEVWLPRQVHLPEGVLDGAR